MRRRDFLTLATGGAIGAAAGRSWPTAESSDGEDNDDLADELVEDPRSGLQRIVWTVRTEAPLAALSFDDGPHPALTPRILDILDQHGVKATFLAMGYAAQQHPRLMADVVAAGHEVGHHSWRHYNMATIDSLQTQREIEEGARLVEEASGVPVRWFRPPKGRLNEAAIRTVARQRQDIVLWSVTRGALDERSPRRVADHVAGSMGPGDIVDLHDGIGRGTFNPDGLLADELMARRRTEIDALPRILRQLRSRGIRPVTIGELMETRAPTEVSA
ncbi:MAG TPA: polysaccharide deacetylase family protein [Acidimicrobiales bacterium]|nr:polysaccharide deacetylase family protein [Acidimicrobiales bacterium]